MELHLFKDDGQWGFRVADTGTGIPEEARTRIFEAFEQVESDHPGSKKGIGLGLSIVKEVTTLMDGEVALDSVEGDGTTFTITLPLLPIPVEVEAV